MRPVVRLAGIGKSYTTGTEALRGVDLDIAQGEFLSLVGPSGCGKSTILRLIAGLGEPTVGSIDWPTTTVDASGRPERSLGFVFQEPTLMPWATVAANVALPLTLKRQPRSAVRPLVLDALAMVGLADFADAYPRALSGGMKMRVSIARALVTRPRVLLMDEPFAALDEITRLKLNDDLLALWRDLGFTAVFVTHSVYESVYLSTRVVVMAPRPGRITADLTIAGPEVRDDVFRTSPTYNEECRRVSAALKEAMAA
ncbi:MAG: ABC transporter ATP-binding protein [Alphaproteobacteria bacterium]|nr:ABC transporter ATP-binding protein [Alphaproteobacteria bacterium]TAD87697.1 MAG: ABC transporter ATP-binding protein [Alphaproteobacteria bacterium]